MRKKEVKNMKKIKKRCLAMFMACTLAVGMLPVVPGSGTQVYAAESVSYIDKIWDEATQTLTSEQKSVTEYTLVTAETTTWSDGGWYVVSDDVTISGRVTVSGEAHLILMDGAKLEAKAGIGVTEGNTLSIYGQSEDVETMGQLTATGGTNRAGIGGGSNGAGIGGGQTRGGGTVTISGGTVRVAAGSKAELIGRGYGNANSGTLQDGHGNALYLNTLTLEGISEDAVIASIAGVTEYHLTDIYGLAGNKLFLYLPEEIVPGYVTAADGTIYCCIMSGRNGTFSEEGHRPSAEWTIEEDTHSSACAYGCGTILEYEHHGGTATCLAPAVCEACGVSYGTKEPGSHATDEVYYKYKDENGHAVYHSCCGVLKETLEHTVTVEATCTGLKYCSVCTTSYGQKNAENHTQDKIWIPAGNQGHIYQYPCCKEEAAEKIVIYESYLTKKTTTSAKTRQPVWLSFNL